MARVQYRSVTVRLDLADWHTLDGLAQTYGSITAAVREMLEAVRRGQAAAAAEDGDAPARRPAPRDATSAHPRA